MSETQELVSSLPPPPPQENKLDLLSILATLLSVDDEINNLISLDIDQYGIKLITEILDNYPQLLNSISEKIHDIIKDEVLNSDDVPILINLVKEVINTDIKKLKSSLPKVEDVLLFVKTILEILIKKDYIKVEKKERVFELIDISFLLLTTSIDIKQDCITCLKNMFKC